MIQRIRVIVGIVVLAAAGWAVVAFLVWLARTLGPMFMFKDGL